MSSLRRRRYVLAVLLVVVGLLAAAILWRVRGVVFFAVTVAYVLYPLRQRLVSRGVPRRIASALLTTGAFVAVTVLFAPLVWTLFSRRNAIIAFLSDLPAEVPVELLGFTTVVDVAGVIDATVEALRELAFTLAASAIPIVLQLSLFVLVLYGLLLAPDAVGQATYRITPPAYHDIIRALHRRVAGTLYALYVIQAATAVVTFPIAFAVFSALGYDDVFVLAVVSAVLQFVPIVGPGVLALLLAGIDIVVGMPERAVAVAVLGPLFVGLLPDLIVRPQLATAQANLPASLYFVGFVGGVLTVGVIGIIAGPLVVALLAEVVELLGERRPAGGR